MLGRHSTILTPSLVVALIVLSACTHQAQVQAQTALPLPPPASAPAGAQRGEGVPAFWVRPGLKVTVAASDVPEARFMTFDDKGTLYVSMPGRGKIVSYREIKGVYQPLGDFVSGYRSVHGLDFADGWVWFTQSGSIHKARDTNGDGKADETKDVIPEGQLPSGGGHWWRSICVTGDAIYTSIGDSGNINDESDTERQKIWRFAKDGSGKTLWASGLRNTEKLRIRPGTDELWGADHGSDWFGQPLGDREGRQPITDWNPPCEFNHYVKNGFYGHPFIVGNRVPRVEYQKRPDIIDLAERTIPPAWSFGAHWAPNGWTFLDKPALGSDYDGDAVVALHGSWNSKAHVGYRVERVLFDKVTAQPYGSLMLVGCLSPTGDVLGRPVDVVQAPDGSILFSDDGTRKIYRISKA